MLRHFDVRYGTVQVYWIQNMREKIERKIKKYIFLFYVIYWRRYFLLAVLFLRNKPVRYRYGTVPSTGTVLRINRCPPNSIIWKYFEIASFENKPFIIEKKFVQPYHVRTSVRYSTNMFLSKQFRVHDSTVPVRY